MTGAPEGNHLATGQLGEPCAIHRRADGLLVAVGVLDVAVTRQLACLHRGSSLELSDQYADGAPRLCPVALPSGTMIALVGGEGMISMTSNPGSVRSKITGFEGQRIDVGEEDARPVGATDGQDRAICLGGAVVGSSADGEQHIE
jgi:hypothetical protein